MAKPIIEKCYRMCSDVGIVLPKLTDELEALLNTVASEAFQAGEKYANDCHRLIRK